MGNLHRQHTAHRGTFPIYPTFLQCSSWVLCCSMPLAANAEQGLENRVVEGRDQVYDTSTSEEGNPETGIIREVAICFNHPLFFRFPQMFGNPSNSTDVARNLEQLDYNQTQVWFFRTKSLFDWNRAGAIQIRNSMCSLLSVVVFSLSLLQISVW